MGCSDSSDAGAAVPQGNLTEKSPVKIANIQVTRTAQGWLTVNGILINSDPKIHTIVGYVDFYDKDGNLYDHCRFGANIDAHGQTDFTTTSVNASNYSEPGTYNYYLQDIVY